MQLIKTIPAFPVKVIHEAVEFYTSKFSFNCPYKNEHFAILERDQATLHLWAANDKSWKWRSLFLFFKPVWNGAESFLAGTHSCRIEVNNIGHLFEELKQKEVLYNKHTQVEKTDWGTKEFAALDLHRNLLTFYERIE